MIGSNVLKTEIPDIQKLETRPLQPSSGSSRRTDPLSEVLALIEPRVYVSGGLAVPGDMAICFPSHQGIKCYAMLAGQCWLVIESVPEPVLLQAGDCFLLPRGLPFQLTTDLSLEPIPYALAHARLDRSSAALDATANGYAIAGGHFALIGGGAEMILQSLPPVAHIRCESDKAAMRSSIERMREELSEPRPGSSLIVQHLAYATLIQVLRLHTTDKCNAVPGWLFALSDKHMGLAIACMNNDPGFRWTLQSLAERIGMSRSVFALRFRETVGTTPMEYLTRWRMLLAADRLTHSSDGLSVIAHSLGYESESAFGKAFRRVMGCSPSQHRRRTRPGSSSVHELVDRHDRFKLAEL